MNQKKGKKWPTMVDNVDDDDIGTINEKKREKTTKKWHIHVHGIHSFIWWSSDSFTMNWLLMKKKIIIIIFC